MGFHKDFDNLIYIESSKEIIGRYINKTFDKLQELICNQNRIDLLLYYPVLQREFNFDGTVKTPDQLIEDMDAQYSRIFFSQELSIKEKNILINQSSEMYFELLYRSFSNLSKEEIDESLKNIEPDTIERIFNLMKNHFELDKLNSLRTLDSAEKALKDCDNQTIPSNLDSQISQIKLLLINEANQRIKFIDIIISENLDLDER